MDETGEILHGDTAHRLIPNIFNKKDLLLFFISLHSDHRHAYMYNPAEEMARPGLIRETKGGGGRARRVGGVYAVCGSWKARISGR